MIATLALHGWEPVLDTQYVNGSMSVSTYDLLHFDRKKQVYFVGLWAYIATPDSKMRARYATADWDEIDSAQLTAAFDLLVKKQELAP